MARDVAVIGLDSMDTELVNEGIAEGWLPVIAEFLQRGASTRIAEDPYLFEGSAWATTLTGYGIEENGIVMDDQLKPGSYRLELARAELIKRPAFWAHAGAAGKTSTVLGAYSIPMQHGVPGTQVVGWGTTDPHVARVDKPRALPPETLSMLREVAGPRSMLDYLSPPRSPGEYEKHLQALVEGAGQQAAALRALGDRTEWDFYFGSFIEAHQGGHNLWHLHDPRHPNHDPDAPAALKEGLRTIYRRVDEVLGDLIEGLGARSTFLLTPHGMGANPNGEPLGPEVLERAGYLVRKAGTASGGGRLDTARRVLHKMVPLPARRLLARLAPRAREKMVLAAETANIDWARSRAFGLPSVRTSYIRLNVRGREPQGMVSRGPEYNEACREIEQLFGTLVDSRRNEPAVRRVYRTDEVLGFEIDELLPDLVVDWADHPLVEVHSASLGEFKTPFDPTTQGMHRGPGFLIGRGDGIPASSAIQIDDRAVGMKDVAPTLLAHLGVASPDGLPGRKIDW